MKPSYDKAQLGATIGGPMVIPKILNWPRASFNFTYQGLLSRNPYNQISSVPTAADRTGDFAGLVGILDGVEFVAGAGDFVEADDFDGGGGAGFLNGLELVVGDGTDAAPSGTAEDAVADVKGAVADEDAGDDAG